MACLRGIATSGIIVSLVLLAGCASFSPSIRVSDKVDTGSAYLYGRFFIHAPSKAFGHQSIGFVLSCRDGHKYTIGLSNRWPLQVIKIAPSICSHTETIFTAADGTIERRRRSPASALKDLNFAPGVAYYLGDIEGEAKFEWAWRVLYNEYKSHWRIRSIGDNYAATTQVVQRLFPALAILQTDKRMLFAGPD